jgi:hypothetical protein
MNGKQHMFFHFSVEMERPQLLHLRIQQRCDIEDTKIYLLNITHLSHVPVNKKIKGVDARPTISTSEAQGLNGRLRLGRSVP